MTRKRLQSILLVTVLCIIAVCVFASCNKKPQEHVHEYGEWAVVREATCESDGLKERACNGCDQTEQETIAALGHSYGEWVTEVTATCTTAGKKGHYEWSVCHKTFDADKHELADLTIAMTEHTYGEWVAEVATTCTTAGVKGHYECSVCHKNFDADKHEIADLTIAKTDHTYGTWVAEIYDGEGYYQRTTLAIFSLDGKSVRLMGIKYDFGENDTLDISVEGNVVYRARDDQNGNMIMRYTLNDNGKIYLISVELDEGGNEIDENVLSVFDWVENDGVITIYEDGMPVTTGKVVNGYFVFDII